MKTTMYLEVILPNGDIAEDVGIEVTYSASHRAATMYASNGDPGDPAESEMDIEEVSLKSEIDSELSTGAIEQYIYANYSDKIIDNCWEDFMQSKDSTDFDYQD